VRARAEARERNQRHHHSQSVTKWQHVRPARQQLPYFTVNLAEYLSQKKKRN
jgi:hypothetical protein